MQMLYVCDCTSEEFVSRKLWPKASPPDCPWCRPKGRGTLVRHGFYARLHPQGTLVRRFRCKASGRTVSMLPDCLASHWPGDLDTMEEVARQAEGKSKYKAAQEREWAGMAHPPDQPGPPDTGLYRWLSRRVLAVVLFLELVRSLYPDRSGCCSRRSAGSAGIWARSACWSHCGASPGPSCARFARRSVCAWNKTLRIGARRRHTHWMAWRGRPPLPDADAGGGMQRLGTTPRPCGPAMKTPDRRWRCSATA